MKKHNKCTLTTVQYDKHEHLNLIITLHKKIITDRLSGNLALLWLSNV